nr:unnamed protein product [Digitaria exilis]
MATGEKKHLYHVLDDAKHGSSIHKVDMDSDADSDAFSPYSLAFLLLSSASAPPLISADTALATSPHGTGTFSSSNTITGDVAPTGTTTRSTSTTRRSLRNWLAKCGHVTTGTPCAMDSSSEFQPQWVRKPPMARCDRMASCGTHPRTTRPRPAVRASRASSHSRASGASTSSSFTTHRNGSPESSRPWPTSNSCLGSLRTRLPKLTKTTQSVPLASSHAVTTLCWTTSGLFPRDAMASTSLLARHKGPSVHTGLPSAAS